MVEEKKEKKKVKKTKVRLLNLEDFCEESEQGNTVTAGFGVWFNKESKDPLGRKALDEWKSLMKQFLKREIKS